MAEELKQDCEGCIQLTQKNLQLEAKIKSLVEEGTKMHLLLQKMIMSHEEAAITIAKLTTDNRKLLETIARTMRAVH